MTLEIERRFILHFIFGCRGRRTWHCTPEAYPTEDGPVNVSRSQPDDKGDAHGQAPHLLARNDVDLPNRGEARRGATAAWPNSVC